jgi:hypothetical protein
MTTNNEPTVCHFCKCAGCDETCQTEANHVTAADVRPPIFPKRCGCGAVYSTEADWRGLPFHANQITSDDTDSYRTEYRHCGCGSTIAIEIRLVECGRCNENRAEPGDELCKACADSGCEICGGKLSTKFADCGSCAGDGCEICGEELPSGSAAKVCARCQRYADHVDAQIDAEKEGR